MIEVLIELNDALDSLDAAIANTFTSSGILQTNWQFLGLSQTDMSNSIGRIKLYINANSTIHLDKDQQDNIELLIDGVNHLKAAIPNLINTQMVQTNFFVFMGILENRLKEIFSFDFENERHLARSELTSIKSKVETLSARLSQSTSIMDDLDSKIGIILSAYDAADRLPTNLKELEDAAKTISKIKESVDNEMSVINEHSTNSSNMSSEIETIYTRSKEVIDNCEKAYSAATTVGLAAAFSDRSENLKNSMRFWISALVITLIIGCSVGFYNLHFLLDKINTVNFGYRVLFSFFSIGGPIWFAWICTKQIGHRFRLSEDYAFKASVASAYEGFRKETSRIDPELEKKLIASALQRFDELPMRFVDSETHGSPWQELLAGLIKSKSANQNNNLELASKKTTSNTNTNENVEDE